MSKPPISSRALSSSRARRPPRISKVRAQALRDALEALLEESPAPSHLAEDPLSLPSRYTRPADVEVAAVIAACIAFGRVHSFLPVAKRLLEEADRHGGPADWAMHLSPRQVESILPIQYRWVRGQDFALLIATLGAALRKHGRIGELFEPKSSTPIPHIGPLLEAGIQQLHLLAEEEAKRLKFPADAHRRRGFISLLSRPSGGSACKRMCMLLRWMSRPPGEGSTGVDLGCWEISPAHLLIPLDTHVLRFSQMLGLTRRKDASWRTVLEISSALRKIDPIDPIRYDFALAHLGISGRCKRQLVPSVCQSCALQAVCSHGGRLKKQKLLANNGSLHAASL